MKTIVKQSISHSILLLLISLVAPQAIADDTEIYIGSSATSNTIKPNIVFIIDTSGSMGWTVPVTTVSVGSGIDFDPSVDYNADPYNGGCNTNEVYWAPSSDTPPSCATDQYIDISSFKCDSATSPLSGAPGTSGFYLDRFARYARGGWGGDTWGSLSRFDHNDRVECEDDWGVHGDGGSDLYPADESDGGPWRSNDSRAINWSSENSYKFFSANYLAWYNLSQGSSTTVDTPKIDIVKSVLSDLLVSMSDVNIAMMRFDSYSSGGYFFMPMDELTHGAGGTDSIYDAAVQSLVVGGGTPLSETLYESYLFFKGASVDYGDSSHPEHNHPDVLNSSNTSLYQSPITDFCQKNFVIFLTDGEPTWDTGADNKIEALPDFAAETGAAGCSGNCLDELADYMNGQDCRGDLPDTQNVITYTIGFDVDLPLLQDTARKGGGQYFTANDTAGLTDAFTSILSDVLAINTTFIAPAVSVNAFNRFTHRDELYYALFRPSERPRWNGNLKKFKLTAGEITDANGTAAIDPNTGFFKADATSFWTSGDDAPDGAEVETGGAAAEFTLPRNVYTNTGSSTTLSDISNNLHEDNSAVTKTMLGDALMSDDDRTAIIQWSRGVDISDDDIDGDTVEARRRLGDPLHSKPVLLTYGGTDEAPDMTIFVSTNAGSLHAFDTDDGTELFSFTPQELLPNLAVLLNNSSVVEHPYGLDGPITYWFNDVNGNGLLLNNGSIESDEHLYLYQAMRRGGRNYYALDVSDRDNPELLWTIEGGSSEFSELGQTWSSATKAKLKINGTDTDVLIFGGGYDPAQDSNETAADDHVGRAIFIVNARTGAKIWQAGPAGSDNGSDPDLVLSEMTNSIPSDINVVDTDGDGYHDRLYVGDMRAQLWRIDLNNNNTRAAALAQDVDGNDTGGVIAKLGGSDAADNRRFYYAPDVSLDRSGQHFNLAIGSGYRAHPLDTDIHDSFFLIQDGFSATEIRDRIADGLYITPDGTLGADGALYDATENLIGEGTSEQVGIAKSALADSMGWYIKLDDRSNSDTFVGEKSLSKSLTFGGTLIFSTYTPTAQGVSQCSPSQGQARTYFINILDATPIKENYDDPVPERIDREQQLTRGGIPPEPTVVISEDGDVIVLEGTEVVRSPADSRLIYKQYWRRN